MLVAGVGTRRSLHEKKGRGIYCRVYHWVPSKSIRPLASFAEVETLPGSCTMESHFFMNAGQTGQIYVRKLACFNCSQCRQHRYRQCQHCQGRCGPLLLKPVKLKSGGREHVAETRLCSNLQGQGLERAAQVREGMLVGSECDNETEPHIVSLALTEERVWEGEPGRSWMGSIKQGAINQITCLLSKFNLC